MEPEDKPQDPGVVTPPPAEKPQDKPTEPDPALKQELDELRAERDRLAAEKKEREDAALSEQEKAKQRADEAEQKQQATEARLRRVAIINGVRDAQSALKVDLDLDAIKDLYDANAFKGVKLDDNGDPIGLADVVKGLVKSKPYIVKRSTVEAPNINADKGGAEKAGENDEARIAELKRRFRLK